jgi:hypothetical protein
MDGRLPWAVLCAALLAMAAAIPLELFTRRARGHR